MTLPIFLGALSVAVGLIGYTPYLVSMFRGKTKPHFFSWLVWAIIEYVAFGIQITHGAGPGAWVTLLSAILVTIVALYSFRYREINIKPIDWLYFAGASVSLVLWLVLQNPLLATLAVIVTDVCAFAPTFRKAWNAPYEESIAAYTCSALKFFIAVFALQNVTVLTLLYPLYLVLANSTFSLVTLLRRKMIPKILEK
jgi:hypothetical protein